MCFCPEVVRLSRNAFPLSRTGLERDRSRVYIGFSRNRKEQHEDVTSQKQEDSLEDDQEAT
jgi:hypothetical protein